MPDIKSELSKVLNQWDIHEQEIRTPTKEKEIMQKESLFKPTNNVSRETFNYVRDNPYQHRKDIVNTLKLRGFKATSVEVLLAQMCRAGSLTKDTEDRYKALVPEFVTIKTKVKKPVSAAKTAPSQGIAALATDTAQEPKQKVSLILNRGWTPEKALENLNVLQARALYDYLKNVFGG